MVITREKFKGDPISHISFNLVLDELLQNINGPGKTGGTLKQGVVMETLAFADDLLILDDNENNILFTISLGDIFLNEEVNVFKCHAINAIRANGSSVCRQQAHFRLGRGMINVTTRVDRKI